MNRREVLEKLEASAHAEAKSNFDYPKDYSVTQALADLAQIEESERMSVEEIKEIIKEYLGCNDHRGWNWDTNLEVFDKTFAIIPESQLKEMSQAIYEAQRAKNV